MRYYVLPSYSSPGQWRVADDPVWEKVIRCQPAYYETRESAEIACALLNLAE